MTDRHTLERLSEEYRTGIPDDLREARSFTWYLDTLYDDPRVARNAHQRVADMFDHYGTQYDEADGLVEYALAAEDPLHDGENIFYGREIHEAIHEFVNKVKSGARGLGPEKRIKLLLGPVGSGKSHFDFLTRRYFEAYTREDAGRMYTFRWTDLCSVIDDQDPGDDTVRSPMNQDPLVLLPKEQRTAVIEDLNEILDAPYTLRNDQHLDPASEFYMDELLAHYDDNLEAVLENHIEVIRLVASENRRECIETFEPKDKKNQDETELTGDTNYAKLAVYGESDPRAFDYAGAFCNANRGLFSGEELLKLQREFLYDFLHASQEGTIKPKNNPRIDIDQVIVGRTNMPEYREKTGDEKMEAFNDRTKRIDYPVRKRIKHLSEDVAERRCPERPRRATHTGDGWALRRADPPRRADRRDGRPTGEGEGLQRRTRRRGGRPPEAPGGRRGVGRHRRGDGGCLRAVHRRRDRRGDHGCDPSGSILPVVFDHFEANLGGHGSIAADDLDRYERLLDTVREEYRERAIEDVRHALAYDVDELRRQGEKYMDHVMAYIDDATVDDELTGRETEPDETFLRAVEEQLDIPSDRKDDFRQEVSNWVSRRAREGRDFDPQDNDRLRRALERKLWEDKKHNINFSALVSATDLDEEERGAWVDALVDRGYSEDGAAEVLEYAGAAVARSEMEDGAD